MKTLERPDLPFNGRWLQTEGGGEVHLIEIEGWQPPKGQHWAFRVEDIDATVAELRDRGVEVKDPRELPGKIARQTFFFDPSGNMIELNQPA